LPDEFVVSPEVHRLIIVAGDLRNSGTVLAWQQLTSGQSALAAIEQGVRAVEANEADWSVGRGGYPNALGVVELDAGVVITPPDQSGGLLRRRMTHWSTLTPDRPIQADWSYTLHGVSSLTCRTTLHSRELEVGKERLTVPVRANS
jgi:hypothetical protein